MAARGQIHGKGKNKLAYAPRPKIPPSPKREDPAKDSICHEASRKKNASLGAGSLCIFVIELNTILNRSWIYDTGCDGFINHFVNNTIQVSRNNMVYFSTIPRDSIFEIDLSNSYANKSSIYAVRNKRAKLDLDFALLWHCRLGRISKKRIEKLQHNEILNSTDLRAFEKCVSCMSGKMAMKPYTHQVERAKDLLGLIHIDVCGPFKIMSRQGASYFLTFTDDFSHYGYVYLLKRKHKVFETFKVFQKEVENQLDKTIKSLRFDRSGEYMSQEFLDHLKDHGIISHRTPPYTPQHSRVSERRNRTLLDMVRSMMSQTTLPKSFWDYALETAARIINMVSTKKALVKRDTLTKPDKLEPRSIKCIFIGYPKETIASGSLEDLKIIKEEDTHPSIDTSLNHEEDDQEINEPQSDINPIRMSTRTRHTPDREAAYILGIKIYRDRSRWLIGLVQSAYIKKNLKEILHGEFQVWKYPMQEKLKLSKSQGALTPAELKRMQNVPYASAVGDPHWTTVKNIIKYLRNTKDVVLVYGGDLKRKLRVSCYTDAEYLTDADDLKSQTGYVFILNGGAVDWKSAKQSIFATSSAEAEYITAFDASKEAMWVKNSFLSLELLPQLKYT
nr:hypothetical protein [Tanacetum cinerariifolium]